MASKTRLPSRYEIHLVRLDPATGRETRKTRPCVIVSRDSMALSGMVVVCPLTTSLHPVWRQRMQIECAGEPAEIMADQIRAVSLQRLVRRLDRLRPEDAETLRNLLSLLYTTP